MKYPLKVIQGHSFCNQLPAHNWLRIVIILLLPYLRSFRRLNGQLNRRILPLSTTPLSFDAPPRGTPANIRINLIFPETRIIGLHFCRGMYGSIFIHICAMCSKRRLSAATECLPKTDFHGKQPLKVILFCSHLSADKGLACRHIILQALSQKIPKK